MNAHETERSSRDSSAMKVTLEDTTLREGLQAPGVSPSVFERVELAWMLAEAGVKAIEIASPLLGDVERTTARALARESVPVRLSTWNRCLLGDVQASLDCGLSSLHVAVPASPLLLDIRGFGSVEQLVDHMAEVVEYALAQGADVSVGAEDAGRAEFGALLTIATSAKRMGATRLRISDSVGALEPARTASLISQLSCCVGIELQAHMHNDLGLATANTIAALTSGADSASVSVDGLGDRAGIAPLAEVAVALHTLHGMATGIELDRLRVLSRCVAQLSGRDVPIDAPIVGSAAFQHESGIHIRDMLRLPASYELISPQKVGAQREFVYGSGSGKAALRSALGSEAEPVDETALEDLRRLVGEVAHEERKHLSASDVRHLSSQLTVLGGE